MRKETDIIKKLLVETADFEAEAETKAIAKTLRYNPSAYFKVDDKTVLIPLGLLDTVRARPKGIKNAATYMQLTAAGKHEKRVPVSLRKLPNGRYTVEDGNSTVAVARMANWPKIAAHVAE